VIRVSHVSLPPGLSAFGSRAANGDLHVYVSDALGPDRQRAAVREVLRASRRAGWRAALLPVPVAGLLAASRAWLGRAGRALRAHSLAAALTAAAVAATVATVVAVVAAPHGHGPSSAAGQGGPGASRLPGGAQHSRSSGLARPPGKAPSAGAGPVPTSPVPRSPGPRSPVPTPTGPRTASPPAPTASPSPRPAPSPSASPSPEPSPSPSPSHGAGGRTCVVILGIWVCL
jgi:hypothetical protein